MTELVLSPDVVRTLQEIRSDIAELKKRRLPVVASTPVVASDPLIFAKQAYGSVNDPGGGPTMPATVIGGDIDYGGLFGNAMTDPASDDGGWIAFGLGDHVHGGGPTHTYTSAMIFGTDPAVDFGYTAIDQEHEASGGNESSTDSFLLDAFTPLSSPFAFVSMDATAQNYGGGAGVANVELEATSVDTSRIILNVSATNAATNAPTITLYLASIGAATISIYSGDPNGAVTASKGSVIIDLATPQIWQNTTGGTVWV